MTRRSYWWFLIIISLRLPGQAQPGSVRNDLKKGYSDATRQLFKQSSWGYRHKNWAPFARNDEVDIKLDPVKMTVTGLLDRSGVGLPGLHLPPKKLNASNTGFGSNDAVLGSKPIWQVFHGSYAAHSSTDAPVPPLPIDIVGLAMASGIRVGYVMSPLGNKFGRYYAMWVQLYDVVSCLVDELILLM
ncbi:hypothetical protein B0H19DRAFT_1084486 [Mycena capillaripes]|nr:hypothetical protein B0H19DRAFT_1084486 [Mycena capillaripes]